MDMEPYLPFEDISLEGLSQPLKGRTRIQYTCFTVSNQFIMIGTNTGGVYVFNRRSRQFISILPGQAGGVTCLSVDGGEQLVAAGSVQGAVSVYACPTQRSWSGQLTALARLEAEVRAVCWRHAHWSGRIVYVGTAAGKVLAISVSKKKTPAASATITPMLQLDSAVCDMVLCGQTLLVSTPGFCYLCNVQMEVFAQVGTQPRSGRLGACFQGQTVFCARPGLRLWEVHLSGQIISTHQLRPALDDATPRKVVSTCDQAVCLQDGGSGGGKSALALVKLVPLPGGAVAAFSGDAVFVLQLAARRVVLWTSVHEKVRDLAAVGDELYVQCEGGAMRRLLVRQPSQIVRELRAGRGVGECARFLMSHGELTDLCRSQLPLQVLRDAVKEFADDAPMQAELTRLAAVLRDRLAEDGVDVGEEERSAVAAPAASRARVAAAEVRRKSDAVRGESERAGRVAPIGSAAVKDERERTVSMRPPENGGRHESVTPAETEKAPGAPQKETEKAPGAPQKETEKAPGALRKETEKAPGALRKETEKAPGAPQKETEKAPGALRKETEKAPGAPQKETEKASGAPEKDIESAQNTERPAITADESSVESVAADSSSEEFRAAPSSENRNAPSSEACAASQPPLTSHPPQPALLSDEAIVFRSSRRRRPRGRERPTEPRADRPPEPPSSELQTPVKPPSEPPAQTPLQPPTQPPSHRAHWAPNNLGSCDAHQSQSSLRALQPPSQPASQPPSQPPSQPASQSALQSPQAALQPPSQPPSQPPPSPVVWHDPPDGDARYHNTPAVTSQMGVYGYTPGLALHPEVLDAFSDLVEDVRGAVSFGAQRLVQRLRRQPSSPASAAAAAAGRPEQAQRRDSTEQLEQVRSAGCAVSAAAKEPTDGRESAVTSRLETSLAELMAAADTAELSLPPLLRWLDAVAAVHCRLQPPASSTSAAAAAALVTAAEAEVAAMTATGALESAAYPALRQLCGEPDVFVCERLFPAPTALREQVSRLLGRAVLFLVGSEEVCEELTGCAVAAVPVEGVTPVAREDSDVATDGNGDASPTAEGTTEAEEMATSMESEGKSASEQGEITSGTESVETPSAVNESAKSVEVSTDADSGIHVSNQTSEFNEIADTEDGDTDQDTGLEDRLGTMLLEDETDSNHTETSQANTVTSEELIKSEDSTNTKTSAAPEDSVTDADSKALRGPANAPPAGSPAWLAELLTHRLFYLLRAAELRAGLTPLPSGPRGRLWRLLLRGTEARLGQFSVRPSGVTATLELASSVDLDWLSLARLAAGLCRADPAAAAALSLQHADRLGPLDALYVCRHASAPGCAAISFSAYLTAAGPAAAEPLLEDAELTVAAEAALTAVWRRQAVRLRCRCGRPRPGAHRVPRPAAALLRKLLSARLTGESFPQQLWTLADFSGWLQTGAARVKCSDTDPDSGSDSHLDSESHRAAIVCQLDDSALLPAARSVLLTGWRPLLTALSAARPGRCCGCGGPLSPADRRVRSAAARRPLTLQALLAFVTSEEGPEAALQLLQTASDVIPQQLTASCYRDIILSTMLDRRAAGLGAAFGAQMLGLTPAPVPEEAVELLYSELGRPAPPPLPAVGRAGATVASLSSDCPACCLPLRNRHLLQPHGLVTFRCGHAFHSVCLLRRGAGCLLCRR